jgi:hypothetical protein
MINAVIGNLILNVRLADHPSTEGRTVFPGSIEKGHIPEDDSISIAIWKPLSA